MGTDESTPLQIFVPKEFCLFIHLIFALFLVPSPELHEIPLNLTVFFDFSLTVKAVPHECVIRTGQP